MEADHIGLMLMAKACYFPYEAVAFWRMAKDYGVQEETTREKYRTHPPHEIRLEYIDKVAYPLAMIEFEKSGCGRKWDDYFN